MWGCKIKIVNRKSFLYLEIWLRDFCKTHTLAGTFNIFTGNHNLSSAGYFLAHVQIRLSRKAAGRQLTWKTPNLMPPSTWYKLHPPAGPGQELPILLSPDALRRMTMTDNAIMAFPTQRQLWAEYSWFVAYRIWEENPSASKTYLFLISINLSFSMWKFVPLSLSPQSLLSVVPTEGYSVFLGCP